MSSPSQETQTSTSVTDSWRSALLWIAGTILWVIVFVSSFLVLGPKPQPEQAGQAQAADENGKSKNENGPIIQQTPEGYVVRPGLPVGSEKVPAKIREFTLTDRTGKVLTNKDLKGKPWVCNFIFTRCIDSCPVITGKMRSLAENLKNEKVNFVSFTIDPLHDTVEQLQTYSEVHRANKENWHFLTGDRDLIYDIIRNNFLSTAEEVVDAPKGYEFAHSNRFFHIDAEGNIVGSYDGMKDTELNVLARVISGKIKTPEINEFYHIKKSEAPVSSHKEEQSNPHQADSHGPLIKPADGNQAARQAGQPTPLWVKRLPVVNTSLNACAGFLLIAGLLSIKIRKVELHKRIMLSAFGVSIAFLICYLAYHFGLHYYTGETSKKYTGVGMMRFVYFTILISHVILAAFVPVLAVVTIHKGIRHNWKSHHSWAKITFPIWLYVSITGVVVYLMLYS